MKKIVTIVGLTAISAALIVMLITQVLAAAYINIQLSGTVNYTASEIGAKILAVQSISHTGGGASINYVPLSGSGTVDSNGIYNESGEALEFSNVTANIVANFTNSEDTMTIYLFIKNKGDRYIVPYISLAYDDTRLDIEQSAYYLDESAGNIDPVELREGGDSASSIVGSVDSATKNEYPINSYIDNLDTYYLRLDFTIAGSPGDSFSSDFVLNLGIMADVQYDAENEHLLTVCQPINQIDTTWTKVGYNATLNAQATKLETNSATNLKVAYDSRDANGNTGNNHNIDDYTTAVVYKDIDIVNVDIATGEIVGKLSDVNYPFEWYGGEVTLPSGTILASGRELATEETFTVDCYTYYPDFYARRWMVGNTQYITISDQSFVGATKIDAYYTGTFESTIFNPDKSVATNDMGGIIVRSYSCWWSPFTGGSTEYLQNYYNFGTLSGSTNAANQSNYLSYSNNLTTAWQNNIFSNPNMSDYITVKGVQGEDYHVFLQNLLYLVKYADNNSQEKVGYGNCSSGNLYAVNDMTITTPNGTINIEGDQSLVRYISQRGGGTIGLKGTAGNSAGEGITFDNAGMAYAYDCSTPMYSQDFLTYSTGDRRFILDGYVGSDKYTGVWCLGTCNPWGNVWSWVFGTAMLYDESSGKSYAYINFDYYDASVGNYITDNYTEIWENNDARLKASNYSRLTYTLPVEDGTYRYYGVSVVDSKNGIQSLVGLPSADSSYGSNTTGLTDSYWMTKTETRIWAMARGGLSMDGALIGAFAFCNHHTVTMSSSGFGFRSLLIL